jgi:hypothetical protein
MLDRASLRSTHHHTENEVRMVDHQPEAQWNVLWKRIEAQGDPHPPYYDLAKRLAEPHRAYHTMRHSCIVLLSGSG